MNTTRLLRMAPYALIMLLLAGPLFFSCSNEIDPWGTEDDSELMTISFNQAGTRTSNDGNSTLWSEGDAISVIHSTTGGNTFWSSWFGFYGGNMFQGSVNRLSSSNDWYAVYPYVEENIAANEINLTFPSRQVQTGNSNKSHFSGEQFPMFGKKTEVARADELSLSMKNLLSAAEFKVTNTEDYPIVVKEVELTGPSYIAGGFKVDLTSDEPVLTAKSGSKTVRLAVTDGEEIAPGENARFYLAVAPFDIPAGGSFEIKVVAENTSNPGTNIVYYHTYELTGGTSFNSGSIKTVNVSFDDDSSQDPDPGTAGEVELEVGEQPEDGVYLLVYENGANSMAFAAFDEYKSQNFAIPVVVADGVVLPQDGIDLARFAVELENAGMEHPNDAGHDAYNVRNSEGKYVFYATAGGTYEGTDAFHIMDSNEMDVQGTTYQYYHTFMQTEDGVRIVCSINTGGNFYLLSYTSSDGFNYQQDSAAGTNLHLFRLGGTVKEHQELAFSAENVTYDFDANGEGPLTSAPTLSGNMTPVTWSSNNVSVATVDDSGHVTIHGVGIAVITAKAEADETFYSDSASYTIEVTSSSIQTWYKADEMEAGKQYLVVSNGYALQNNNGSVAATAVSVSNETIMLNAPSGILWTADSSNRLTNNNQYLGSSSSSSGGGYPGWGGTSSLSIGSQSSAQAWTYDAESNLLTCSISSQWGGATTYYLYYSTSSNAFSINSSASDTHIAALYSTTKPADKQYLSFANSTVRWTVGDGGDHALNQSYDVQAVSGAATTVTYTSSDTDVATINGTRITLKGIGTTTITATAKEENGYKSATARYTLRVTTPAPAGFVNLGAFNLESDDVKNYLDAAETSYTDDNYRSANGGAGTSIVSTYTKDARSRRMDLPNPVTIDWGTASSGTTTITIFADQDLTQEVWVQNTTNGKTSAAVYNLIPEKTYYCTVEDNTGYLLKGVFTTEGRRRMMLVSTTQNQNNANNCRDLGGLKTTDGRRIKYGMIYRGTNLDGTKNKSIDNYVAPNDTEQGLLMNFMNVGYDIDLRAGGKSALPETQVQYVYGNMDASLSDVTNVAKSRTVLQGFYDAAAAGKAAYFHCAIGSDRTGFWGLLIEGLLGVSVKDCSIDFELTGFAGGVTSGDRPRNSTGYLFFQGMENSSSSTGFKGLRNYEGNTFQEKCANYVKSLANDQYPFTDEWIETFRNNVLEDI